MDLEQLCADCKHRFGAHYTSYGKIMGCAQGTLHTIREYTQFDKDEIIVRCMCRGFAEVIERDEYGHPR